MCLQQHQQEQEQATSGLEVDVMVDSKKYDGSQWKHSLRKLTTATEAIENPLYTDGTAITSYTISGNTVQNGTPTPSNPVDVVGVGERTENLFDESILTYGKWTNSNGRVEDADYGAVSAQIEALSEKYSAKCFGVEPYSFAINWYDINNTFISRQLLTGQMLTNGTKITTPQNAVKMTYQVSHMTSLTYPLTSYEVNAFKLALVEGSTAPSSYIPYGYKIPISSGQQTTNIYLGSTQTVRAIKKLVLDGTENWTLSSYPNTFYTTDFTDYLRELDTNLSLCSHYRTIEQVQGASFITDGVMSWYGRTNVSRLYIGDVRFSTAAELQTYLGQQYAAGTPIVVWYVLTTPETATVNEPLMKIGNYADTLSNATAIPTTEGANSITVDTTVQPSEFTATWTGWHDANVKEWDGSDWS
jgi:hypothetical protein